MDDLSAVLGGGEVRWLASTVDYGDRKSPIEDQLGVLVRKLVVVRHEHGRVLKPGERLQERGILLTLETKLLNSRRIEIPALLELARKSRL
jgi:hypothetical protein